MTTVQINLPDELAQKAASAGLLSAEAMEAMWQRGPKEELTPEIEQEIVQEVRKVRSQARLRGCAAARGELMAGSGSQPLRLVLDTNIVVTGLLWNGPPRRLVELAIEGEAVELYSSPVPLDELADTLGHSKFAARIESFGTSIAALVGQYTALVSLVVPASVPRIVAGDDDHVIAAAVAARPR